MAKIRLLIADDHAIMRDGIKALLNIQSDMEVVGEAAEGREAVDKTEELNPDIVIMDIAMPGMDGLEATRRITKRNPQTKVVVLTQYTNKEYVLSSLKAGAAGFIPKRALGSDLVGAIRAVYAGESYLYPSAATAVVEDFRQQKEGEDPYDRLTAREREILKLIAEGRTSREISDRLVISLKTVLGHRARIMEKLELHNRTDLIKFAMRKGLVTMDT